MITLFSPLSHLKPGDTFTHRRLPGFTYVRYRVVRHGFDQYTVVQELDGNQQTTLADYAQVRRTLIEDALPGERVTPLEGQHAGKTLTIQPQAGAESSPVVLVTGGQGGHPHRIPRGTMVNILPSDAIPFAIRGYTRPVAAERTLNQDITDGQFVDGSDYVYNDGKACSIHVFTSADGKKKQYVASRGPKDWTVFFPKDYHRMIDVFFKPDTFVTDGKQVLLVASDDCDLGFPLTATGADTRTPVQLDPAVHRPCVITACVAEVKP